MDTAGFEDRHAVLNPEQGLRSVDLRQQEAGPSAVTRMCSEEFG
jgi:hypothetical protein